MSTLHPIFQSVIAAHLETPAIVRRAAYVTALKRHDWSFEFSDDHHAWRKGTDARKHLRAEQAAIDIDGALWNANCPAAYKIGGLQ